MHQLTLDNVVAHSFRERQRAIDRYIVRNKARYTSFARAITPDIEDDEQVWSRVAFAILSANAPFASAVKALTYAIEHRGRLDTFMLAGLNMVPAKKTWLDAIPQPAHLIRESGDTWHSYRMRLTGIKGLGLAKASFAACLLYPLTADLACLDTHMQKVYCGHTSFRSLSVTQYLTVEGEVRKVAKRHGLHTFLAQWLIWDHARGTVNDHDIFPGSHKDDAIASW